MKIFISWSGRQSRAIAEALNTWLPLVIQSVEPFYSPEMEKGINWSNEIDNSLEGTRFGIVCLTPDNLNSTWIHYETGALSKIGDLSKKEEARIWTFLFGLKPSDVPPPLSKFQHTTAEKGEVFKMLKSINGNLKDVGVKPLLENVLKQSFDTYWPKLETWLNGVKLMSRIVASNVGRSDREVLDEILELVRNQAKQTYSPSIKQEREIDAILNELQRLNRPLVYTALEDAQIEYRNGVLIATFDRENVLMRRVADSATLFHEIGENLFGQPIRIEVKTSGEAEEGIDGSGGHEGVGGGR